MLQLCPQCWLVLQGFPQLHPNWFTKVQFVGYEPKETKIKFRFMPSVLQYLSACAWQWFLGIRRGCPGGWCISFPCGCNCTAPNFTNFHHVYSRLWWGPIHKSPAFGSSLLPLKNGLLPYSVFTQKLSVPQFLAWWSHACRTSTFLFFVFLP